MIQLVEKGFRPMNINILLMFKKVEENIYPMREIKKKKEVIKFLLIKNTTSEAENILDEINSSLDVAEENISDLKIIAVEIIQNEI